MDVLQGLIGPSGQGQGSTGPWTNLPVDPLSLPVPGTEDFRPLSPLWLQWQLRRILLAFLTAEAVLLTVWFLTGREAWYLAGMAVPLGMYGFARTFIHRAYRSRVYVIRQRDITYREGWIWWTETSIPYQRIQHCGIEQGPIEKMVGLATLELYTAGKSTSDLSIPGLELAVAESLKAWVLDRIRDEHGEEE